MPSDKPRITLRIQHEDMDHLEKWAKEEFLTVPQLARVIVRRAIADYLEKKQSKQNKPPTSGSSGKAKRGLGGEE